MFCRSTDLKEEYQPDQGLDRLKFTRRHRSRSRNSNAMYSSTSLRGEGQPDQGLLETCTQESQVVVRA
jgi:hypothetical protein